jgi:hypothetical protein
VPVARAEETAADEQSQLLIVGMDVGSRHVVGFKISYQSNLWLRVEAPSLGS